METVGHYIYFMQLTIASSDGELEQQEIDDIVARAAEMQLFGMFSGMGHVNQGEVMEEACHYHDAMVNSGQIVMAFAQAAGIIAASINPPYDREVLSEYYNSMITVAAADGEIEPSERSLLEFVKAEWGV